MKIDRLAERIAARRAADQRRADALLQQVPLLARHLRAMGATRVVLFGSLASDAEPHERTDVDLCVEGLTQAQVERASLELASEVGPVDLVRWETAPPQLRGIITAYGLVVEGS